MRAEGVLHTSVSGAWHRPRRWCGEEVALDKRRAAARLCSHPSAHFASRLVQPNSRELSAKCMGLSLHDRFQNSNTGCRD